MLIQDMLTGYLHEVPDQSYGSNLAGYGYPYGAPWPQAPQQYGQVVYDGFGNPVGLPVLAALAPLAAKAVGAIAPMIAKAAPMIAAKAAPLMAKMGPSISNLLPMVAQALPGAAAVPSPLPFAPAAPMTPGESLMPPARGPAMLPPVMPGAPGMLPYPLAVRRRRRGRRVVIRRRIVPPPRAPSVEEQVRTEPAPAVAGYGYYGGFRGYGW